MTLARSLPALALAALCGLGAALTVLDRQDAAAGAAPDFASETALGEALFFDTNLSQNRSQACATCHNPHERGVIRVAAAAKGADEQKRLRGRKLCLLCHDK